MNNPYSQNPQQSGRNHWNENQRSGPQGDAWNTDEYRSARPTWRGENPNRAHNRSPWSNQDSYSQSRYSPNFDAMSGGYGEYDWEGGRDRGYSGDRNYNSSGRDDFGSRGDYSNRDAYGYYGSDMQGQGGASPWMTSDDYGSGNYGSRNFGRPNYDASANYIGPDRGAAHYSSRQNFATSSNPVRAFFDTGEPPRWSDHSQRWGEQPRSASNHRDSGNFGYRGDAHSRGSSNFSAFGESDQFESNRGAYGLQRSHKGTGPKGYVRSDERICEDICEKLSNDPRIDASETSVQVRDGVVTLEGSVSQRWQKHCIEDLADNCSGVKDVHNNLRVAQNERGENAHAASGQASPAMNATTSTKTGTSSPTTSETQAGSKSSKS